MIVNFYKTKLSGQNRCYNKASYEYYLDKLSFEGKLLLYEASNNIVPNTVFYVPRTFTLSGVTSAYPWEEYNYITFEYEYPITDVGEGTTHKVKYGAFITKVQQISVDGTVAIYHTIDNWYYLLMNDIDYGLHGQCVQAHVNDLFTENKKLVPKMVNTYMKPEYSTTTNGFTTEQTNVINQTIIGSKNYHYIYMYVNNPNQTGFSWQSAGTPSSDKIEDNVRQQVDYGFANTIRNIGLLMVGVVNDDGLCCFLISEETLSDRTDKPSAYKTYLLNLRSEVITRIVISDIPPNKYCSIKNVEDSKGETVGYIYYNSTKPINLGRTNNLQGMPTDFSIMPEFSSTKFSITPVYNSHGAPFVYTNKTDLTAFVSNTYENYLTYGLCKLYSPAYNPLTYNENLIDYSLVTSDDSRNLTVDISIGIDCSTQYFYYSFDSLETIDKKSSFTYVSNTQSFVPTSTKSYFDTYDLSLASVNRTKKFINYGFDLLSSGSNVVTSVLDSIKGRGNTSNVVGSSIDFTQSVITTPLKYKATNLEYNRAKDQITNGKTASDTPFGIFATIGKTNINSIYITRLNEVGYKSLKDLMHRYGYSTMLQLDSVLKDHQRAFFNFIQATNVEVEGVPIDIADDISSMFESGVHLWTITYRNKVDGSGKEFVGSVSDWEQPNWQMDVYNSIRKGESNV